MSQYTVYVGIHRERGLVAQTIRGSAKEVWDAIYFNELSASQQFSRKNAPRELADQWVIVQTTVSVPSRVKVGPYEVKL